MTATSPSNPGDPQKAKVFFSRGDVVAATDNFEYAIEMYVQGLAFDPDNLEGHRALREISIRRKAHGGKDVGMIERMKLGPKKGEETKNALNTAKLLAYDPSNRDRIRQFILHARAAGMSRAADWMDEILRRATGSP